MWGKNSHVMLKSQPSNHRVYVPIPIDTGKHSISKVECGAWHCVAVTGINDSKSWVRFLGIVSVAVAVGPGFEFCKHIQYEM